MSREAGPKKGKVRSKITLRASAIIRRNEDPRCMNLAKRKVEMDF